MRSIKQVPTGRSPRRGECRLVTKMTLAKAQIGQLSDRVTPLHLVYGALLIAYLGVRLGHLQRVEQVAEFYDTLDYARIAFFPLTDGRFWSGIKPPVIPLQLKLTACNLGVVAFGQTVISTVAWITLAITLARQANSKWVGGMMLIVVLIFSLNAEILAWDTVILSESPALSLTALFVASWFWLVKRQTWPRVALVCILAIFWALTRDVHAWLLLSLVALTAVVGLSSPTRRRYLWIALILIATFVASFVSAGGGEGMDQRWVLPLVNVITRRVLTNPEQLAWFEAQGMPVTPDLLRLSGNLGWENNWAPFDDFALQPFRDWLVANGKPAYIRYMLSHPFWLVLDPLRHLSDMLVMRDLHLYASKTFTPPLPAWLTGFFFLGQNAPLLGFLAAVALIGGGMMVVRSRFQPRRLIPWAVLALAWPHAIIVWHGDAAEIGRHSITVSAQLRLALWMIAGTTADTLWQRWRRAMPISGPARPLPRALIGGTVALACLCVFCIGWVALRSLAAHRQANLVLETTYRYVYRQPSDESIYIPRPTPLPGSLFFGLGNMPNGRIKSFCTTTGVLPTGIAGHKASFIIHPDHREALEAVERLFPGGVIIPLDAGLTVYRADNASLKPQFATSVNWAGRIELLGYDLASEIWAPGEMIPLTVYWRAVGRIERPYTFFVHLVGEQNNPATGSPLWGQHDAQPGQATYPTTFWSAGEVVIGEYRVPIPADAPPGHYELHAGLYFLPTLERLPVVDQKENPLSDHVVLTRVQVK